MGTLARRLARLEERARDVQAMTDAEIEALLAKDPQARAILASMTDEELQAVASGDLTPIERRFANGA